MHGVLGGALAIGAPSGDAVLVEHVPVQPGGYACRACGYVYNEDLPVCPAVVAARAGYAQVADRMRVEAEWQVTPVTWLQVAYERLEARVDALAAADVAASGKRSRRRRRPSSARA